MLNKTENKFNIKTTDKKILADWYHTLTLGRMLDERAPNYLKQAIGWSYHAPYAGHDGIQLALGKSFTIGEDHMFPYYRDMLSCLAAGLSAEEIILNGISKATDVASGGRHMSNHFAKPEWKIHNVSSCTGNHILHAVGVARAMKYYKHKGVAFSSQGESSLSEGYCYEAINGADREQLPVIFVIQDNGYGISVPKWEQTYNENIAENYSGFKHLRIIYCDGRDIFDSMNAMALAKRHVMEEGGPVMVYAHCVRIGSHSNSDKHELYRDEQELADAKAQDPLPIFRKSLLDAKIFTAKELEQMDEMAKSTVIEAHGKAMKAPNPDPASIFDHLYAPAYPAEKYPEGIHDGQKGEELKFIDALNHTLKEEFRHNPNTFIWGQDVANKEKGGVFNVTKGMQAEFGRGRVFNAPIAEDFIVGTANGFSRFNPDIHVVVEGAEFADYFWPAMEQLIECSHDYWRSNGAFSPNVVIRLASGGYIGGGLYHSQNLEGMLTTLPGIRIVVPAFADDAAGLLRTAMRSQGPTLYLEPKALYNAKQASCKVPPDFEIPFGKARIRRAGRDLTLITYGNTVHQSIEAAEKLSQQGHDVEVIDLRSLIPLDEEAIFESLAKTNRCLIVHEDKVFGGFGGELVAMINEKAFDYLDAPPLRFGSPFIPVGFNRILERETLPNTQKIIEKALEVLTY